MISEYYTLLVNPCICLFTSVSITVRYTVYRIAHTIYYANIFY